LELESCDVARTVYLKLSAGLPNLKWLMLSCNMINDRNLWCYGVIDMPVTAFENIRWNDGEEYVRMEKGYYRIVYSRVSNSVAGVDDYFVLDDNKEGNTASLSNEVEYTDMAEEGYRRQFLHFTCKSIKTFTEVIYYFNSTLTKHECITTHYALNRQVWQQTSL
jgi:hypothetical protein